MSKESATMGKWKRFSIFIYRKLDEDGTGTDFETDTGENDTPTKYLDTDNTPTKLRSGIIERIHYRLNPTNAVTYVLRFWNDAVAANVESSMRKMYQSPDAQADDEEYDREVIIPFILVHVSIFYYGIDWSAASGVTSGYIDISGVIHRGA